MKLLRISWICTLLDGNEVYGSLSDYDEQRQLALFSLIEQGSAILLCSGVYKCTVAAQPNKGWNKQAYYNSREKKCPRFSPYTITFSGPWRNSLQASFFVYQNGNMKDYRCLIKCSYLEDCLIVLSSIFIV